MIPLSLYIHIPWCIQKCPYCDFNSHKSPDERPEKAYIQALLADLRQDLERFPGRMLTSIFIGGGTPSLLSASAYETLFTELKALLSFQPEIEITLEANPGTVDESRFSDYHAVGINRLSLGIQSFNAHHLKLLGRIHDDQQAHRAIERARKAGFTNINLDIMHGLPNQSIQEGLSDLQAALSHQPEHLSWYQLTIEPNTLFYKHPPMLPDDDTLGILEDEGFAMLAAHQFHRYEISAFSRENRASKHNLNYWLFGDYLGIGAGAHGKLTTDAVYRTRKQRQPNDYLNATKPFMAEIIAIKPEELLFEFMLNTTRLKQPISHQLMTERTGLIWDDVKSVFEQAKTKGLITIDQDSWQVTPLGWRFANDLQAMFLGKLV